MALLLKQEQAFHTLMRQPASTTSQLLLMGTHALLGLRSVVMRGVVRADFTAVISKQCAKLVLTLDAYCVGGTHSYSFGAGCFKSYSLQPTVADQTMQITDIDTEVTSSISVTHTYTCSDGQILTQTKTIPVLQTVGKGVFIGVDGTATKLGGYNCTLPNSSYTGQSGKPIYVTGLIAVNKAFTFSATEFQFHPGNTGFDMTELGAPLTLNNSTKLRGVDGETCDYLWRGLSVYNKGVLICDNIGIRDALFGININGSLGTKTSLKHVQFMENYVGIYITRSVGTFSMESTSFDGGTDLREAGTLLSIANTSITVPGFSIGSGLYNNLTFNSDRGFVGIYSKTANLILPVIQPKENRNSFLNLNYGILAFDANLDIRKNSTFSAITTTSGYASQSRTASVALFDRSGSKNTLFFDGALDELNSPVDFNDCKMGIYFRCHQGTLPSKVNIQNTEMDNMRTGIFLDARFGNGAFSGNSQNNDEFLGVHNNKIRCTQEGFALASNAGIALQDFWPTISALEIYNNEVKLENSVFINLGVDNNGTEGITGSGFNPLAETGTNVDEIDIHDNRVMLSDNGQTGIGLTDFPNGIIRNNRGGNAGAGNGVFSSSNNLTSAIRAVGGDDNKIMCNEVKVSSNPLTNHALMYISGTSNGLFLQNQLDGLGRGVYFDNKNSNVNLRCNTMNGNTIGLYFDTDAFTGNDQGSQTESFGNIWSGSFSQFTAKHDGGAVEINASQFYVRNQTGENPVSPSPSSPWFHLTLADVVCLVDACPVDIGFGFSPDVSDMDSLVANGGGDFSSANRWQLEFDLYRKLLEHPSLVQSNTLMSTFKTSKAGSVIDSYWQLQTSMRNSFKISDAIVANLNSNFATIKTLTSAIGVLDGIILTATDTIQLDSLMKQRAVKDSLVNTLLNANEQLAGQYNTTVNSATSSLLSQVNALSTSNTCEANLKTVFAIYLGGPTLDSVKIQQLKSVAEQCPNEGGISVLAARSLYGGWVGFDLDFDDCESSDERNSINTNIPIDEIAVYPNPTDGIFNLVLPEIYTGKAVSVKIINSTGVQVFKKDFTPDHSSIQLDLSKKAKGVYFVSVYLDGKEIQTLSVIVQ